MANIAKSVDSLGELFKQSSRTGNQQSGNVQSSSGRGGGTRVSSVARGGPVGRQSVAQRFRGYRILRGIDSTDDASGAEGERPDQGGNTGGDGTDLRGDGGGLGRANWAAEMDSTDPFVVVERRRKRPNLSTSPSENGRPSYASVASNAPRSVTTGQRASTGVQHDAPNTRRDVTKYSENPFW